MEMVSTQCSKASGSILFGSCWQEVIAEVIISTGDSRDGDQMSSLANIGIISDGHLEIYYDRHGGISAPLLCLGGPSWIRESACEDMSTSDSWLGEVYAEGGLLLDFDERVLLVHGGAEHFNELGFRRAFLALVRDLNPAWTIDWAHGGQGDFVAHLGLDPSCIFSTVEPEPLSAVGVAQNHNPNSVCSVRTSDGLQIYALDLYGPYDYCSMGHGLIDRLAELPVTDSVIFDGNDIYEGGLHIDLTAQALKVWTMSPIASIEKRFAVDWPDWEISSWGDSIEHHIVVANNRIQNSTAPEVKHLIRLKNLMVEQFADMLPRTAPCLEEIERRMNRYLHEG